MDPRTLSPRPVRLPDRLLVAAGVCLVASCGGGDDGAAPGAVPFAGDPAQAEAVRFLTRASFGPSPASVAEYLALGPQAWLEQQLLLPGEPIVPELIALGCTNELLSQVAPCPPEIVDDQRALRNALWWERVTFGPDQLRQRVAFALSEVMVVSEKNAILFLKPTLVADYWDTLVEHAFSDFRTLLEEVTLHPAMGAYLSMAKNRKADPVLGTHPDENYAREVMQLFSIGLEQLGSDGTPLVDGFGQTLPTYDQDDIENVARVLTGWTYASIDAPSSSLDAFQATTPELGEMVAWPAFHDTGAKVVPPGIPIPAGLAPEQDLALLLDVLASSPSTAPFISRRLIQRLVTANPSPDYVERVVSAWNESGGNLGQVVVAILTDPEADAPADPAVAGKLREPILRVTAIWRAFGAQPTTYDPAAPPVYPGDNNLGQLALGAPSVFNFFSPDYTTPELAAQGLVSPEQQLNTHSNLTSTAILLNNLVRSGNTADIDPQWRLPRIDIQLLIDAAADLNALLDLLDLRLMGGQMGLGMRSALFDYLAAVPLNEPSTTPGYRRATDALYYTASSAQFAVQR